MQNGKQNTHTHTQMHKLSRTQKNVQSSFKEEQSNHKTRGKNITKK